MLCHHVTHTQINNPYLPLCTPSSCASTPRGLCCCTRPVFFCTMPLTILSTGNVCCCSLHKPTTILSQITLDRGSQFEKLLSQVCQAKQKVKLSRPWSPGHAKPVQSLQPDAATGYTHSNRDGNGLGTRASMNIDA